MSSIKAGKPGTTSEAGMMTGYSRVIEHDIIISQAADRDCRRQFRRPRERNRPAQGNRVAPAELDRARNPGAVDISPVGGSRSCNKNPSAVWVN